MAKQRRTSTHTHVTNTPEALARDLVARVDLRPDVSEIGDAHDEQALLEAYIAHYVAEDCREEIRAFLRDATDQGQTFHDALPESMRRAFTVYENHRSDLRWIHQAIGYLIGVEVGRRLR